MTVFSATEEQIVEDQILHAKTYFNMPEALTVAGAIVETTPVDVDPFVVVGRELITGQDPCSGHPIAAKLIDVLEHATAKA